MAYKRRKKKTANDPSSFFLFLDNFLFCSPVVFTAVKTLNSNNLYFFSVKSTNPDELTGEIISLIMMKNNQRKICRN